MSSSENEREVCVFYQRIGACRHGLKCSRIHKPPKESKTVLIRNLFRHVQPLSTRKSKTVLIRNLFRHVQPLSTRICSNSADDVAIFEDFYEEVYKEVEACYGKINQMHVCENLGEHLIGNVYIKFRKYSAAERAVKDLNNRYFAGFPIFAELSPVDNFRDAVCRQHDLGECSRGGFCNFLHIKHVSTDLEDRLDSEDRSVSSSDEGSSLSDSESESEACSSEMSDSTSETSSESTKTDSEMSEDDADEESSVPRAFRIKPLVVRSSDSEVEEDNESTREYVQTGRRLRWQIFRKRLSEETWDDAKERQYVFSLLDLT
uniref:Uncharacterized protein n=1 Tax=Panagrolaimus sp. JU765 TaxID=591449 RepID=A0AC34QWG0_9BILA